MLEEITCLEAHSFDEHMELLGLGTADRAFVKAKLRLSQLAMKAISESGLSVNEIVERSGVARSRVSAIKNGSLTSISLDLYVLVIAAASGKGLKIGLEVA